MTSLKKLLRSRNNFFLWQSTLGRPTRSNLINKPVQSIIKPCLAPKITASVRLEASSLLKIEPM
jgi:hypothetical protein